MAKCWNCNKNVARDDDMCPHCDEDLDDCASSAGSHSSGGGFSRVGNGAMNVWRPNSFSMMPMFNTNSSVSVGGYGEATISMQQSVTMSTGNGSKTSTQSMSMTTKGGKLVEQKVSKTETYRYH